MRRTRGTGAVLALFLLTSASMACKTSDPGFPGTETLRLQLTDNGLTGQTAQPKGFQVTTWVVDSATIHIEDFGDFDFLGTKPCVFTDNLVLADDFARACLGTGLILEAQQPVVGELRLVIRSMLLRTGVQPVLEPEQDYDGDGFTNRDDNCPILPNPLQGDVNGDGLGDVCSMVDPRTGESTLADSDGDEIPDGVDNCALVPNHDQQDSIRGFDFIGDACEQFSDVTLPSSPAVLTFPVEFTPDGTVQFTALIVDFNSKIAIRCNEARTVCKLDPSGVAVRGQTG